MNKKTLDILIKRLLLPKYPWILAHDTEINNSGPTEYFTVNYYISPDWLKETIRRQHMYAEVEKLTHKLFDILGPEEYQMFHAADFYLYDDDNQV